MLILGIETSCDETAAAVVRDGRALLANVVASQVNLHAPYGGVFPEVASRQHIRDITPVVAQALRESGVTLAQVDAIAVTRGPGLPGSLAVGLNAAKGLALGSGKPLIGVNHLEGHLYSAWLHPADAPQPEPPFPLLALIVSGGHTELVLIREHLQYQRLGGTLDDAAGEAFDKVARLLGLGYPGGPAIEKAAHTGRPDAYTFPRAFLDGSNDFSFSGLKTAVLRQVRQLEKSVLDLPIENLAASFQQAVVDVLVQKTVHAAQTHNAAAILLAGGVSANRALRDALTRTAQCPVFVPPLALCTDNAAMIAAAGSVRFAHGQRDALNLDLLPNWGLYELQTMPIQ